MAWHDSSVNTLKKFRVSYNLLHTCNKKLSYHKGSRTSYIVSLYFDNLFVVNSREYFLEAASKARCGDVAPPLMSVEVVFSYEDFVPRQIIQFEVCSPDVTGGTQYLQSQSQWWKEVKQRTTFTHRRNRKKKTFSRTATLMRKTLFLRHSPNERRSSTCISLQTFRWQYIVHLDAMHTGCAFLLSLPWTFALTWMSRMTTPMPISYNH